MRFRHRKKESLLLDAAKGVVAGAVATFAMGQLTSYLCEKESTKVRKTEDKARRGKSAYVIAAEKAARAGGKKAFDGAGEAGWLRYPLGRGGGRSCGICLDAKAYSQRGSRQGAPLWNPVLVIGRRRCQCRAWTYARSDNVSLADACAGTRGSRCLRNCSGSRSACPGSIRALT